MAAQKIPRSFGTHDGAFHADEVTACALLLHFGLIDRDKIVRSRDMSLLERCEFMCDVGGVYDPAAKRFDHHQVDYQGEMSSAGMILLYLKDEGIISESIYNFFRNAVIKGVDDHDNGRDPLIPGLCTYSHIIANYVPYAEDTTAETQNDAFYRALDFASGHLRRIYNKLIYMQDCKELVRETMERDRDCLFFDKYIPWLEVFFELGGEEHPAKFIIMPSGEHWKLRGVPPSLKEKMKVRQPLPSDWAGLLEEELKEVSGIPEAIFCHKGRFISVWETKEGAVKALNEVLSREERV